MAYEFGMGAFHDWAKIIVAAFLVIFFGTGITGLVLGKCLIIPAYQRARRTAMKDASRQMAVSKTREEQERSEKLLVQLEKIGETPIDKKKLASVLLQPLLSAAPLAGYGEGVQKFFQDVLKTL